MLQVQWDRQSWLSAVRHANYSSKKQDCEVPRASRVKEITPENFKTDIVSPWAIHFADFECKKTCTHEFKNLRRIRYIVRNVITNSVKIPTTVDKIRAYESANIYHDWMFWSSEFIDMKIMTRNWKLDEVSLNSLQRYRFNFKKIRERIFFRYYACEALSVLPIELIKNVKFFASTNLGKPQMSNIHHYFL